ncbi:UDP-glycosyltransferase UGT5 isoform X2 [Nilaparvata lugens]|uniref:UDP-glycosyltransferase UGT5 isoform X2 n=1 Tax=Nilaparvata lugens TaxID=108931 RepID=UPI00193D1C46|nr:UDP-glycosyltransferase UGT5 isoform X2 [Nilaparvata lugens]
MRNMNTLKLSNFFIFFLIVLQSGTEIEGYNILCIFPSISYSHQKPMLAVSEALARKGHNVTAITLNPNKKLNLKNYRQVDANSLYEVWARLQSSVGFSLQQRMTAFEVVKGFVDSSEIMNRAMLYHPAIDGFARELESSNTTYDVVIYEALIYTSLLGMVLQNGKPLPPTIGLLTLSVFSDADWFMGNPFAESYIPTLNVPFNDQMTFYQRLYSLMVILYTWLQVTYKCRPIQEALMKERFGQNLPSIEEIERNRSMLFYLNDFTTGYLRPVQQNTIFVGPINVENQPVEPLPQDLQEWMDGAEEGVIYFSLGSNMKGTSFPAEKRAAFIDAFSRLDKFRVLWKWEDDRLPDQPSNTLIRKWLPQNSILAHPKTKLFISQMGHQSSQEAINFAIPMLGIPIYGDQLQNALKFEKDGISIHMDIEDVDFNANVYNNIQRLLTNITYKQSMLRLQRLSRDKPMSAADTAVWWVEYVARHKGAPHLRPTVLDLPWYQVYLIDIILFVLAVLAVIILSLFMLLKMLCRCRTKADKKVKVN